MLIGKLKLLLSFIKWLLWDFTSIRFIVTKSWKTIRPSVNPETGKRPPSTFLIWVSGVLSVYVGLFGIAAQRYESRVDVIENTANTVFSQLSIKEIRTETLSRVAFIQNMSCPHKPIILEPVSVIKSLLFKDTVYPDIVELMKDTLVIWKQNLNNVKLTSVNLSNAIFIGGNLSRSNLRMANLSYVYFLNANLSRANLSYADISDAAIEGSNLSSADLTKANLSFIEIFDTNLSNANLLNTNLSFADLVNVDLTNANLSHVNFMDTSFSEVKGLPEWVRKGMDKGVYSQKKLLEAIRSGFKNLEGANLLGANLSKINLNKANFINANLKNANLTNANIAGANFQNAILIGAKGLPMGVARGINKYGIYKKPVDQNESSINK